MLLRYSAHLYVNANACLYLQTQLLFYGGAEAKNCTEFSSLSTVFTPKTYATLHTNVSVYGCGSDQGKLLSGGKTSRKKSSSRTNSMRTSECRTHHYCLFRSYCIPP